MAQAKYNIKRDLTPPNKKGICSVRLRITSQSRRVDLHTGITLTQKQWGKDRVKQGCVVNGIEYNILNDLLRKQEEFVANYFRNCTLRSEPINLDELKRQFNYTFKSPEGTKTEEFFYIMLSYIEKTSQTKSWTDTYKSEWMRVRKSLHTYNDSTNWNSFDESYMNGYLLHLSQSMLNEKIKKNLIKLREFLKWAKLKKYPVNDDFFLYKPKLPSSHKAIRFLTNEEVTFMLGLQVSHSRILEQTRDFFVFQCCVGLRFSDLKRLKKSNIVKNEDGFYLEILTKKDSDVVRYKLPKLAAMIYMKYAKYEFDEGVLFPLPSNQKYNEHLKQLGAFADIQGEYVSYHCCLNKRIVVRQPRRDIESHDARRTFVVMALNENIDLNTIALLTSHSDIRTMQPYVKLYDKGKNKVIDAIDAALGKK